MKRNEDITEVLGELLRINNDRIGIYRKAVREIGEHDLKIVFQDAIVESKKIQSTLALEIFKRNGLPDVDGTTGAGKLHLFWLELKDFVNGKTENSMLNACRFSEYCVQRAYREALEHDEVYGELSGVLNRQMEMLRKSHETLKAFSLSY